HPYEVSAIRLFAVFALVAVVLVMLPGSPVYNIGMPRGKLSVRIAAGAAAVVSGAVASPEGVSPPAVSSQPANAPIIRRANSKTAPRRTPHRIVFICSPSRRAIGSDYCRK
ncbi:MAG: hypothetical protein J6P88_03625, partial [Clostridia bacterium]|nr:hypothetical protein [Clostridia bacterium]